MTRVWSLGWEDPLENGMATHSSILAWRIPWTEEPVRLQSGGVDREWDMNESLTLSHFQTSSQNSEKCFTYIYQLLKDMLENSNETPDTVMCRATREWRSFCSWEVGVCHHPQYMNVLTSLECPLLVLRLNGDSHFLQQANPLHHLLLEHSETQTSWSKHSGVSLQTGAPRTCDQNYLGQLWKCWFLASWETYWIKSLGAQDPENVFQEILMQVKFWKKLKWKVRRRCKEIFFYSSLNSHQIFTSQTFIQ